MNKEELERRTMQFAVGVVGFVGAFESSAAGRVIGNQLLKSATSIGANYREANRAVSRRDFTYKISIAEKEASETAYWLEICAETSIGNEDLCAEMQSEALELLAIFTSVGRSLKENDRQSDGKRNSRVSEKDQADYVNEDSDIEYKQLLPLTIE